jgi:hypothetical protein
VTILFKPVSGSLDINTEPSDLPEQSDGINITSAAMVRCENLRLDRPGVLLTRDGSSKVGSQIAEDAIITLLVEQGGVRYEFLDNNMIFEDEVQITTGAKAQTPIFSPDEGVYAEAQTVTITSLTLAAVIYYTTDGSTPSALTGKLYTGAILLPDIAWLKAIATKQGYEDSEVESGFYSVDDMAFITETNANSLITETDSNQLTSEGD